MTADGVDRAVYDGGWHIEPAGPGWRAWRKPTDSSERVLGALSLPDLLLRVESDNDARRWGLET